MAPEKVASEPTGPDSAFPYRLSAAFLRGQADSAGRSVRLQSRTNLQATKKLRRCKVQGTGPTWQCMRWNPPTSNGNSIRHASRDALFSIEPDRNSNTYIQQRSHIGSYGEGCSYDTHSLFVKMEKGCKESPSLKRTDLNSPFPSCERQAQQASRLSQLASTPYPG